MSAYLDYLALSKARKGAIVRKLEEAVWKAVADAVLEGVPEFLAVDAVEGFIAEYHTESFDGRA